MGRGRSFDLRQLLKWLGGGPKSRAYVIIRCHIYEGGYNLYVQKTIRESGLKGWMRAVERPLNAYIELEVEGAETKLNAALQKLRLGPVHSQVKGLQVEIRPYKGDFHDFRIRS